MLREAQIESVLIDRVSGLQSDVVFFKGYAEDIQQYIVFLIRMCAKREKGRIRTYR